MNQISNTRLQADTAIRFTPAKPAAMNRPAAIPDRHRFGDTMETAMTGMVFIGALLFGAGILHILVPAGMAALAVEDALRASACLTAAATLAAMFRAFRPKA